MLDQTIVDSYGQRLTEKLEEHPASKHFKTVWLGMTLTRCERLRDCTEWDWVIQCSASQSLYFQLSLLSDVSISIHFECIWYIELYQFQDVPKYQHFDAQLTDSLAWFSVRLQHSQDKFVRVAPTDWGNELWDFMELQKFWNCEMLNPCCFQISKTYFILDQKLVRHGTLLPCCVGHPARLLCGRALRCGGSGNWHPAAWGKSRLKEPANVESDASLNAEKIPTQHFQGWNCWIWKLNQGAW